MNPSGLHRRSFHPWHMKPLVRSVGSGGLLIASVALALFASIAQQRAMAQTSEVSLVLSWSSPEVDCTKSVTWADYDGDGDLDLAVGKGGDSPNQLYRNDGGVLTTNAVWSSDEANDTNSAAWGDYDGDGDLDLAVGNGGGSPNQLYRNDDGVLTTSAVWSSVEAEDTKSVAWGDHDGDGDLDLAVGNWGSPNRLYRNDGGALTISSTWSSDEADATISVAWGDYDGDGDLDLVVGNHAQPDRLYRNDGGALMTSAVWSSVEAEDTKSVAWGDYDGDGDLDLVVAAVFSAVLYRNDSGMLTVSAGWTGSTAYYITSVAWGDYDGDGDVDLALGRRLYRNDDGVLTSAVWFSNEVFSPTSVAWGDYDGDGDLDLVMGGCHTRQRLYRNDSGVLMSDSAWPVSEVNDTTSVAWGDYDGDGDLDLAVGNDGQPDQLYCNGDGVLTTDAVWSSDETASTTGMAWGDYDGDGDLDLVVGAIGPNLLYRNDGGGLTTNAVWSSDEDDATYSVAWGDYDGDGDLDLAVGNYGYALNSGQPNRLYRNDNGTLTTSAVWSSVETNRTESVAWGDYDGDGDLDLAVGNARLQEIETQIGGENRVYRNDGGVLTSSAVWVSHETDWTHSVAWGDYDGDGDLDLTVGNGCKGPCYLSRLYRNDSGVLTNNAVWSSFEAEDTWALAWGDYDGDGDLDLVVGNGDAPNRLYRNDNGVLITSPIWSSDEAESTRSVARGDYDGDSDLDLAIVNYGQPNRLYRNTRVNGAPLANNPPYVTIPRPGATDNADLFSTPYIIQAGNIPITYTLFDPEGDPVSRIIPEFSLNGGGQWFPATAASRTMTTNLAASPLGMSHIFVWDTAADQVIRNGNAVFRIRAQPNAGPILWPALDGKSPSFRVAAPQIVRVVDENSSLVEGAEVYHNRQWVGATNQAGLLDPGSLAIGDSLVALAQQAERDTVRDEHDGWVYRTYITNISVGAAGDTQTFTVSQISGEQLLVVRPENTLLLFNLLVSIEWDATDAYLDQIARAVQYASDYVYDLTDGQMAFGQVVIYDNAAHWADADLQISTKNIVRPHAYVGGITSDDKSHVIRVGRGWDGRSGNQGPWDAPDGYRTLAHEFGHYALHLYDEYFAYVFDQGGNLSGEVPAYCTGPENRDPAADATNASVMDYQYTTSELSARGVPGLWSALCEETAQWQLNGESAWKTLARTYTNTVTPPRWKVTTPLDRGGVMAGPTGVPTDVLALPAATISNTGASGPPRQLTVYAPQGEPYPGAIVALYKQDGSGRVIGQGFTSSDGQLDIYGAGEGDTLRAAAMDGGLAGRVTVTTEMSLTLTLAPVGGLALRAAGERGIPHMRVIAEPSPDPSQVDLLIFLLGLGPGADPEATTNRPNSDVSYSPPTWSYSPTTDTYEGQVSFSASQQGTWRIRARGALGNSLVRLQSTYRLQRVLNGQAQDIYSDDGNLSLHLDEESLLGDEAYLVVMPPGALPGPLPAGLALVGDPYDVTASGALVELEKPAVLKLHYDEALVSASSMPEELDIYRWDPNDETWQAVAGELDEGQRAMVAPVTTLGTYALLAPPPPPNLVFLPIILKGGP